MRKTLLAAALAAFAAVGTAFAATAPTDQAVVQHYAELVHANYADALAAARELREAVRTFVAAPSEERLAVARKAWLAAREPYGQTEAFRFYGGPIDDDKGPEGRINAWPLDEAYIDYVEGNPKAGIVNNPKVRIDRKTLAALNEKGGEENISTGWHAIEFLLWGQDRDAKGAGQRPASDYTSAANAERRKQYLLEVTELLVADLEYVTRAWAPNAKNYRAKFEQAPRDSLKKILVGLGSLSRAELAGERMEVALDNKDQEDEHSCFSDNTHRDIVANAAGIRNVFLGRYRRLGGTVVEGASLYELVKTRDAALADATRAELDASVAAASAIPAPFDQAILGDDAAEGRRRIRATIDALQRQTDSLVAVAKALGIQRLNVGG